MADDRSTEDGLRVGESSGFARPETPGISASESLAAVIDRVATPCQIGAAGDAGSTAISSAGMTKDRPTASPLRRRSGTVVRVPVQVQASGVCHRNHRLRFRHGSRSR